MEKSTSKREYRFDTDSAAGVLRLIDENDKTVFETRREDYSAEIKDQFTVHGMKQKFTDDTMSAKLAEGQSRVEACKELADQLAKGEWTKEREGIARPPEALVLLVMEVKALNREVALASLKSAGKEKWDAIAKKYTVEIEAIKARIAKAKKDAEGIDLSTM